MLKLKNQRKKMMMKKVHAEIEYINSDGNSIHSDICPPDCDFSNITEEYKKFLHDCLEEWLIKSGGTGQFYIKAEDFEGFGI